MQKVLLFGKINATILQNHPITIQDMRSNVLDQATYKTSLADHTVINEKHARTVYKHAIAGKMFVTHVHKTAEHTADDCYRAIEKVASGKKELKNPKQVVAFLEYKAEKMQYA